MADDAYADFLFEAVLERLEQFKIFLIAILHFKRPNVTPAALEINFNGGGVACVVHHALHIGIAPASVNPQFHVVQPLDLAVKRVNHELHFFMVLPKRIRHKVERWFLNLNAPAAGIAQRQQFFIHRLRHIPDYLALVFVLGRVDVEE